MNVAVNEVSVAPCAVFADGTTKIGSAGDVVWLVVAGIAGALPRFVNNVLATDAPDIVNDAPVTLM